MLLSLSMPMGNGVLYNSAGDCDMTLTLTWGACVQYRIFWIFFPDEMLIKETKSIISLKQKAKYKRVIDKQAFC